MSKDADLAFPEFEFRPYVPGDIPFIQSSWGSSYYDGTGIKHDLSPQEFHEFHRPIREHFLNRPTAAVIVCAWQKDPDTIIGWIAVEKPRKSPGLVLHYIYVKQAFKGEKIAQKLVQMALPMRPIFYTHLTEKANKIMRKNAEDFTEFIFVPHLV